MIRRSRGARAGAAATAASRMEQRRVGESTWMSSLSATASPPAQADHSSIAALDLDRRVVRDLAVQRLPQLRKCVRALHASDESGADQPPFNCILASTPCSMLLRRTRRVTGSRRRGSMLFDARSARSTFSGSHGGGFEHLNGVGRAGMGPARRSSSTRRLRGQRRGICVLLDEHVDRPDRTTRVRDRFVRSPTSTRPFSGYPACSDVKAVSSCEPQRHR